MGRKKPMPPHIYEAVMERSGGHCEAMIPTVCTGRPEHWHHRRLRSQGGKHEVVNGLAVCTACHEYFHRNPEQSYERGWLVKSVHEPSEMPVEYQGMPSILTESGEVNMA